MQALAARHTELVFSCSKIRVSRSSRHTYAQTSQTWTARPRHKKQSFVHAYRTVLRNIGLDKFQLDPEDVVAIATHSVAVQEKHLRDLAHATQYFIGALCNTHLFGALAPLCCSTSNFYHASLVVSGRVVNIA
jgi:hypothetical protein